MFGASIEFIYVLTHWVPALPQGHYHPDNQKRDGRVRRPALHGGRGASGRKSNSTGRSAVSDGRVHVVWGISRWVPKEHWTNELGLD